MSARNTSVPLMAQPDSSGTLQRRGVPVATSAYRPLPTPRVLQTKSYTAQPRLNQSKQTPKAPAIYRPQQVPTVVQTRTKPGQQSNKDMSRGSIIGPPIYRPEIKKIVQPKIVTMAGAQSPHKAPPVFRSLPASKSLQKNDAQTCCFKPVQRSHVKPSAQQHPTHEPAHTINQHAGLVRDPFGSRAIQGRGVKAETNRMGTRSAISNQRGSSAQVRHEAGRLFPARSVVQRFLMKGNAAVSKQQFAADAQITIRAGGINPLNLQVNDSFLSHVYNYYSFVRMNETTAIGTALRAYWNALTKGQEFLKQDKGLLGKFDKFQSSKENGEIRKLIEKHKNSKDYVVIFRGATATQADKIMTEKTMGGAKSAGIDLPAPSESAAALQTGLNIKQTKHGAIEEWSRKWGGLTGFSSGGVMLMALVPRSSVATTDLEYGEMGATGYAAQPLIEVAVFSTGNQSLISGGDRLYTAARYVFDRAMGVADKTGKAVATKDFSKESVDKFFT